MSPSVLPLFSGKFIISGNTPLREAEIVVVANIPSNADCEDWNVLLINQIWCNHLILIESEAKGVAVPKERYKLTNNLGVPEFEVQGCDLLEVSQFLKLEDQISKLIETIESYLSEDKVQKFKENAQESKENVRSSLQNLVSLLESQQNSGIHIQESIKKIKAKYQTLVNHLSSISYEQFSEEVNSLISFFHNAYKSVFERREESFMQAAEVNLKFSKKVLMVLNINHVACDHKSSEKEKERKVFTDYLKTKKFVIIHLKEDNRFNLQNNPNLWSESK